MTKVLATEKAKVMPQVGKAIVIGDTKIALFETTEGKFYALEDYCPLTKAPILEGLVAGDYVFEPMRDYKISLVDGKIQEPDEGQVKVFPVTVAGDDIYIEI